MKKFFTLCAVALAAVTANADVVRTTIWENDGTGGPISWSGAYRFGLEGHDGGSECIATFDEATWTSLMTETFYISIEKNGNPNVRITNGWWDTTLGGADYNWAPSLQEDENGVTCLEVNLATDPDFVATLEQKHLLFTGDAYTLLSIYQVKEVADEPETPETPVADASTYPVCVQKESEGEMKTSVANEEGVITVFSLKGAAQDWDTQFWICFDEAAEEGTEIEVSFDYMSSINASIDTQAHGEPGEYLHWEAVGTLNSTSSWQTKSWSGKVSAAQAKGDNGNGNGTGMKSIAMNLSKDKENDVTFYFRNISLKVAGNQVVGLDNIKVVENGVMYNLNGQRVNKANGIVVKNGKLMLVK